MLSVGSLAGLAVVTAAVSALLVGLVRRHALQTNLLDRPSTRGSHDRPTPRGGGLGAVVAALGGIAVTAAAHGWIRTGTLYTALAGVALVAVVGWLDDRSSLPVAPRLVAHLTAGAAVAWFAQGTGGPLGMGGAAALLWWVIWTVAAINVVNFMDGIDGLIGLQMVVWGAQLVSVSGGRGLAAVVGVCIAGASAGFLCWNWAPARIFLGDVGSGSLGVLAVIGGVAAVRESALPVELVFLPLLPIFLDASVTLTRRLLHGEPVWQAHRNHLYQRLANGGWGHARTAAVFGAAAAAGVLVSGVETSYRPLSAALYTVAVVLWGVWLDRRASRLAAKATQSAPSP